MKAKEFNKCIRKLKTDRKIFNFFYKYYFPKIVVHINSKFIGLDIGEDIAQEFFLDLLKKEDIPYIEYPNSWIYTIAEDMAKNRLKKEKIRTEIEQKYVAATENKKAKNDYEFYWEQAELRDKLDQLDNETRKIIIMNVFEGYKFHEIAAIMNLKPDAVRQRFSRGIKKLKNF